MNRSIGLAAACAATVCGWRAAHAHIGLGHPVGPEASCTKATFQIGHGCGTSATRQIVDSTEVPTSGRPASALQNLAPLLEVLPSAAGASHAH